MNLTQIFLEVEFRAEAAAVAAENMSGKKIVALGDIKKPVAAAAELAARLSKQPRTAAVADWKALKLVHANNLPFILHTNSSKTGNM